MARNSNVAFFARPGVQRRYPLESLIAHLRAPRLDRRLARGEDPGGDPLLVARAAQLAGRRARHATAAAWEHAIEDGTGERRGFSAAAPVRADQVRMALPELLALVARLRDDLPVWPAGVARARRLLADGGGPLYDPAALSGALGRRVHQVLAQLDRVVR
jgi:hypothetical protein